MKVYKEGKEYLFLRFYRNTFEIRLIEDGEILEEISEELPPVSQDEPEKET